MKNTCRILAFLMAALMLLLAFTACGKKDQEPSAAFVFSHNGVDIKIGDSDSVIEKLGNWKLVNSTEYCGGFAGKEYTYTYEGFNIYTVPNQNGNVTHFHV